MGLDIYLYHAKDHGSNQHPIKGPREDEVPETPSSKYPEHMFKLNHFRSSYNDGGFNRKMEVLTGKAGLKWIFGCDDGSYEYRYAPDWAASLERAKTLLREFSEASRAVGGAQVLQVRPNMFVDPETMPHSSEEALKLYKVELERYQARKAPDSSGFDLGSYSNKNGDYWLSTPITVMAIIPGVERGFFQPDSVASPVTFVVYKSGDDAWYAEALEIVIESIEWVLAKENSSEFYFHWSG